MRFNEFKTEAIKLPTGPDMPDLSMLAGLLKDNPAGVFKSNPTSNGGMDLMKLLGTDEPADDTGSKLSKGTISKSSGSPANAGAIKQYLVSKGLDKNQVAGIMANIKHESNFDPGAIGDNGTSGGLFQHHAGRFQQMVAAAGKNWKTNWKGQIDFALSERAGAQYANMKFRSPEDATHWWTVNFEIPANKYAQARIRSQSASQFA